MLKKAADEMKKEKFFYIFIAVTAALLFAGIVWVYHVKVLNAPKVYSDGFGYYVYLPATFIYHDFSFGFVDDSWYRLDLSQVAGHALDKYPVGVAVMESPFFFAAHLICLLRDHFSGGGNPSSITATGYSDFYQYMILFGGIFYWIVGTTLLYKLLQKYLGFSAKTSLLACAVITYGTNLFHYAGYDACFSHIYSYFLFILFLYYLCWYEKRDLQKRNRLWHTCIFGLLAGLIFMCRNTNILFVLTYVLYGVKDLKTLKSRIVQILKPGRVVPIVLTGFITLAPQLLYWHTATGRWFVYSYGGESFYWLKPQFANFLFSVRKGLFFWSPILLLSAAGIVIAYRKRQQLYTGLVVFLLLIVYVSCAWWAWAYGGSYGQRVAVDFMCVFAIFLAYVFDLLENLKRQPGRRRIYRAASLLTYGYCTVCIVWNLICMRAYWYRVLPWDEADWNTVRDILHMAFPIVFR